MALPPHARDWMNRAEIDYIGPFVKAWAAFNAWYRDASGQARERAMLNFAVSNANSRLRRRGLPLLENGNVTAEAGALKQAIFDLHLKLDAIHFEITPKGLPERVSLRTVCITPREFQDEQTVSYNYIFRARKVAGGHIEVTVTGPTGNVRFQHTQERFEPALVYARPEFAANLTAAQQLTLRTFYDGCNPRPMRDLVQGGGPVLTVAAMDFQCTPQDLLAGLVETVYAMRNALLHGEVDPDEHVLACYEPAYRIVMSFLRCIA
ncbi:hypothetical protein [Phenylobacterium sp.]|uniref:hypothetical protein n=1 Tax=Phenylobacterium sp. TaxID=1871053 RepID=UPI0025EBCC94|nr:hypothetical protein [Phenylobacterium sp.]MCA3740269.1 hypothetical protein [Phenylobacterium sp.]